MHPLEGRTAIVTGAGGGIGAAVATLLAQEGAAVVVNDLGVGLDGTPASGPSAGQGVCDRIGGKGGTATAVFGDVTQGDFVEHLVDTAVSTFGTLDIVVNTVGILRDRMEWNMTDEEWDSVMQVHLKSALNLTKFSARHWRSTDKPEAHRRLIHFTSGSGLWGAVGQANYAAAKMGVVGLTYSSAKALGRFGVTVNAVAPTARTRMTESVPKGSVFDITDPDMSPENVAPAVAFLASPSSSWCNGQVLVVHGHSVGLLSHFEEVATLERDENWTLTDLNERIRRTFSPQLSTTSDEEVVQG